MAKRLVRYEVGILLEGNGDMLELPNVVSEQIAAAITRSEGEGTLSGDATNASAKLVSIQPLPVRPAIQSL